MVTATSSVADEAAWMDGETPTRRERLERCLARATDPAGEGGRTFLTLWEDDARSAADAFDLLDRAGYRTPLDGLPVSVKDLFDVRGEVTRAAAHARDDLPPPDQDAAVVARLKRAGAVLVGRTNMTPFAYSVVGLNHDFGTPCNPADPARTPGGSSSGAAVSVAAGMAEAALGSDTVGSVRVPAALCGVVAFKPTQRAVPRSGAVALSDSLDSIGPLAKSVEICAKVFAAISEQHFRLDGSRRAASLRLAIPAGEMLVGLDATVARAFKRACDKLRAAGARVVLTDPGVLIEATASDLVRTIQSVEAYASTEALLARRGEDVEPLIRERLLAARNVSSAEYARALQRRTELVGQFDREAAWIDAFMLPTVPEVAPTIAECEIDEDKVRSRLLRNTAPFNLLDACALSLPIHIAGELPVGLMLAAPGGRDIDLLEVGRTIEATLAE